MKKRRVAEDDNDDKDKGSLKDKALSFFLPTTSFSGTPAATVLPAATSTTSQLVAARPITTAPLPVFTLGVLHSLSKCSQEFFSFGHVVARNTLTRLATRFSTPQATGN